MRVVRDGVTAMGVALPAAVRTMVRAASIACGMTLASLAAAQTTTAPPPVQDCGSVVLIKCDKPVAGSTAVAPADPARREAARRMQNRRADQLALELDRLVVEGDGERRSPEAVISGALSRPLVRQGENSFSIGEGAQCTCRNICPPWPLPCCECTDRVGSRHATSPGWKPTN